MGDGGTTGGGREGGTEGGVLGEVHILLVSLTQTRELSLKEQPRWAMRLGSMPGSAKSLKMRQLPVGSDGFATDLKSSQSGRSPSGEIS